MSHSSRLSRLSMLAWSVLLATAIVWYVAFRVVAPLRYEPFTRGFGGNDFKHMYLGASMLVHGQNPYEANAILDLARKRGLGAINPYVYLPFTGLVMSPLTALDPPEALRVWFWLNHLFLIAALGLIFWSLGLRPNVRNLAVFAATAALCYPLHRTLTAGQLNCALLFLFALVFALKKKGWFVAAGAVAAFAFLFKLIPGILLPYFIWRAITTRRAGYWRAAAAMCVVTGLLLAASVAWVGLDVHLAFRPVLSEMSYGKSTWAELNQHFYRDPANQSFNSLFHHLVARPEDASTIPWRNLGPRVANLLTQCAIAICWLAFVAVEIGTFRLKTENRKLNTPLPESAIRNPQSAIAYSLFLLLALLTPSIYWDHYAVIALFPFFAVYACLREETRALATALLLLLALPLGGFLEAPPLLTGFSIGWGITVFLHLVARHRAQGLLAGLWGIAGALLLARFLFDLPAFRSGAGLLVMSLKLWGTLVLFVLCLAVVPQERSRQEP